MENQQDQFTQDRLPFSIRENVIYEDKRVDRLTLDIYNALCYFTGNDRRCWPGYQKIADAARVSRPSAIKGVKSLINLGYLTKKERVNSKGDLTSNLYHLVSNIRAVSSKATLPPPVKPVNHPSKTTLPPQLTDFTRTILNELDKDIYVTHHDHVQLKESQFTKLQNDFGKAVTEEMIERLDSYLTDHPEKQWGQKKGYKDHSKTIRNWIRKDQKSAKVIAANFRTNAPHKDNMKRCPQCGHQFQNLSYCPECLADEVEAL